MNNTIAWTIILIMLLIIIYLVVIKRSISKLFISILIFVGALIGAGFLYLIYMIYGENTEISDTIKTMVPLIASLVAAASVVIATYNTVNGDKSSRKQTIIDLINITRDILEKGKILNESNNILKEINDKLKSDDFLKDVLVNNGAREFYIFLNKDSAKEKEYILDRLDKCFYFEPGSPYHKLQHQLVEMLKSNEIKDMRKLWVNINQIAGGQALKHNILYKSSSYILNEEIYAKEIVGSSFYSESLLKNDRKIVDSILRRHSDLKYEELPIQYHEVYRVCNNILEAHYEEIGHFFRTIHRTLKTINAYYEKNSLEYREHIGMLRAQIPNQVALVMFYNAVYSEKGRGMARELLASNFFGDSDDFHFNQDDHQLLRSEHFLNNDRLLNNQDAHIAHKWFTYNKESNKLYNEIAKMDNKVDTIDETELKEEIFTNYLFNKEKRVLDEFLKAFNAVPRKLGPYLVYTPKKIK